MIYEYMSKKGGTIEREFSIVQTIPREIKEKGIIYKRKFTIGGIHIPEGFCKNQIKYNKSPSRRKHYY